MNEVDPASSEDVVDYGHDDTPATRWRSRRRLAALALAGIGTFLLTPMNQAHDEAVPDTAVNEHSSKITFPQMRIHPGRYMLSFTPMGSFIKTPGGSRHDRLTESAPVRTEFEDLHCHKGLLYGRVAILLSERKMLFEDTQLPFSSMSMDCWFDNQLTPMGTDRLTFVGAEPYEYIAHRRLSGN